MRDSKDEYLKKIRIDGKNRQIAKVLLFTYLTQKTEYWQTTQNVHDVPLILE